MIVIVDRYATDLLLMKNVNNKIINDSQIMFVSFESFVLRPEEGLTKLEDFIGRKHHPRINKILKKQKIPRKTISNGKGHEYYGWQSNKHKSEKEVYEMHWNHIVKNSSVEYRSEFVKIIEWYNNKFPSTLSRFQ